MKRIIHSNILPVQNTSLDNNILKNQKGQTVVEFILLLASISIVSFGMMSVVNTNISQRWEKIANIILDDPTKTLTIK